MVAQQRREAVNVLRRLDEMRRSQRRPTNGDIVSTVCSTLCTFACPRWPLMAVILLIRIGKLMNLYSKVSSNIWMLEGLVWPLCQILMVLLWFYIYCETGVVTVPSFLLAVPNVNVQCTDFILFSSALHWVGLMLWGRISNVLCLSVCLFVCLSFYIHLCVSLSGNFVKIDAIHTWQPSSCFWPSLWNHVWLLAHHQWPVILYLESVPGVHFSALKLWLK